VRIGRRAYEIRSQAAFAHTKADEALGLSGAGVQMQSCLQVLFLRIELLREVFPCHGPV